MTLGNVTSLHLLERHYMSNYLDARHSFVLCLLHVLECWNNAERQLFQGAKCGQWFVTTARMQLEYEALRCRSHMWDGLIIAPHLNS